MKTDRIMLFSWHDAPFDPIFKNFNIYFLNILELKDQITLINCLFIHEKTHKLLPSNFNDFFLPCSDLYDTVTTRKGVSKRTEHGNQPIFLTEFGKMVHIFAEFGNRNTGGQGERIF